MVLPLNNMELKAKNYLKLIFDYFNINSYFNNKSVIKIFTLELPIILKTTNLKLEECSIFFSLEKK